MPTAAQMQNMITRTAGKVQFTVKAFNGLTHAPDKSQYQPIISEFKKALDPLRTDTTYYSAPSYNSPKVFTMKKTSVSI